MWLWFSVLISLLPLFYNAYHFYFNSSSIELKSCVNKVISNGELLLICIPICGALLGELLMVPQSSEFGKLFIFGSCIVVFFFSVIIFGEIWIKHISKINQDMEYILNSSYSFFLGTILVGVATKFNTIR